MPEPSDIDTPESWARSIRGAKVAYWAKSAERRLNAEILSQNLVNTVQAIEPEINDPRLQFQNRGATSVTTDLCQKVAMPALVLYVGYLTNDSDRALLTDSKKSDKLAEAIADGLMNWSRSFSPLEAIF